jgi:outer membrane protease
VFRFLTLTFSCAGFLAAAVMADPVQPHFEVGTSFVWGDTTELVLRDGTYNNPVSRLVWPIPPSLEVDLSVEWPWTTLTSTTVALSATFPLASGTMVDEDWTTTFANGNPLYYGRSESQADMTSDWSARAEQNFFWNQFRFSVGGIYRWTSWQAWNATGYYYSTSASTATNYDYQGLIVSYQQQWLIPYLGIAWTWKNSGWQMTPSVRFSPYTWCFDLDNHFYPGSAAGSFFDNTQGGIYGQAALEAEFSGGPGWTWGIRGGWEAAWGSIGDTTLVTSGKTEETSANSAGAWFQETSLTIFIRN